MSHHHLETHFDLQGAYFFQETDAQVGSALSFSENEDNNELLLTRHILLYISPSNELIARLLKWDYVELISILNLMAVFHLG
jgi:hypothetical protein